MYGQTDEVAKKRVVPYPIELILNGVMPLKGKILKLAELVFLCDFEGQFIEIGDELHAEFVITVFSV
jgi:hypothetical protein